jgi:hypothetical protein
MKVIITHFFVFSVINIPMADEECSMADEECSRDTPSRQRNVRSRKKEKRSRKGKKVGFKYVIDDSHPYLEPTITLPMSTFR